MPRNTLVLVLAPIISLASGAAFAAMPPAPLPPAPQPPEQEVIYGFVSTNTDLTVQVYSGGCAHRDDFSVAIVQPRCIPSPGCDPSKRVTIVREKPVYCRGFLPQRTMINFNLEELGMVMQSFILQNPISHPFVNTEPRP